MPRSDRLREAELALLNAPFEQDGWARALELVAHASGGAGVNLVGLGGPQALSLNLLTGRDGELVQRYFAEPELWGSCNWRVNCAAMPMTIVHERHYDAYRQGADTTDYDDAVADLDMQFGCQAVLISDPRSFVGAALFRGRREGPCGAETLASFHQLLRPFHRALRLQQALSAGAAELIIGDVGSADSAVLLIDGRGCVAALTARAETLAGSGGPIRISGRRFELSNWRENARMQRVLASLLADPEGDEASWVQELNVGCDAESAQPRWTARAFRLPTRRGGLGFDARVAIAFEPLQGSPSRA
jgi:hypothetical protein